MHKNLSSIYYVEARGFNGHRSSGCLHGAYKGAMNSSNDYMLSDREGGEKNSNGESLLSLVREGN